MVFKIGTDILQGGENCSTTMVYSAILSYICSTEGQFVLPTQEIYTPTNANVHWKILARIGKNKHHAR